MTLNTITSSPEPIQGRTKDNSILDHLIILKHISNVIMNNRLTIGILSILSLCISCCMYIINKLSDVEPQNDPAQLITRNRILSSFQGDIKEQSKVSSEHLSCIREELIGAIQQSALEVARNLHAEGKGYQIMILDLITNISNEDFLDSVNISDFSENYFSAIGDAISTLAALNITIKSKIKLEQLTSQRSNDFYMNRSSNDIIITHDTTTIEGMVAQLKDFATQSISQYEQQELDLTIANTLLEYNISIAYLCHATDKMFHTSSEIDLGKYNKIKNKITKQSNRIQELDHKQKQLNATAALIDICFIENQTEYDVSILAKQIAQTLHPNRRLHIDEEFPVFVYELEQSLHTYIEMQCEKIVNTLASSYGSCHIKTMETMKTTKQLVNRSYLSSTVSETIKQEIKHLSAEKTLLVFHQCQESF